MVRGARAVLRASCWIGIGVLGVAPAWAQAPVPAPEAAPPGPRIAPIRPDAPSVAPVREVPRVAPAPREPEPPAPAPAPPRATARRASEPSKAPPAPATAEPLAPPPVAPARNVSPIPSSELSVRDADELARIYIDEQEVGVGQFHGTLSPGQHRLRVARDGFEPFDRVLELGSGEVHAETVALRRSVDSVAPGSAEESHTNLRDGIYGGLQFLAAFSPGGSGSTPAAACDTTGATRCDAGSVLGGGLSGYVGWFFDPLGLELALLGAGDVVDPVASFDGVSGSEINPILAAPERDEKFTIGRFGGGAALRARFAHDVDRFRFTAAIGPGILYRALLMRRSTDAPSGYAGEVTDSRARYWSPMLSLELGAHVLLGASTAIALGVTSWFEHAGDGAKTAARNDTYLYRDGSQPLAQATPAYDVASGTQWFVGPFLGLSFGL